MNNIALFKNLLTLLKLIAYKCQTINNIYILFTVF